MISAVTGASGEQPKTSIADSVGSTQDMFLQLLVAQVKYQDPLEPMNNNEYMAQTAQFTMVEQITKVAEQQSELLAFQRAILAAGMVGRNVSGYDELAGTIVSGVVDAVEYNYGDPQLVIGKQRVGLDEITRTGVAAAIESAADADESVEEPVEATAVETDRPLPDAVAESTPEVGPV